MVSRSLLCYDVCRHAITVESECRCRRDDVTLAFTSGINAMVTIKIDRYDIQEKGLLPAKKHAKRRRYAYMSLYWLIRDQDRCYTLYTGRKPLVSSLAFLDVFHRFFIHFLAVINVTDIVLRAEFARDIACTRARVYPFYLLLLCNISNAFVNTEAIVKTTILRISKRAELNESTRDA